MKKIIFLCALVWLLAAGCVYYPYSYDGYYQGSGYYSYPYYGGYYYPYSYYYPSVNLGFGFYSHGGHYGGYHGGYYGGHHGGGHFGHR